METSKLLSLLSTIVVLVNVLNTRNNVSHQVYAYSDAQTFGQLVNSISYGHLSFYEHYCSSYLSSSTSRRKTFSLNCSYSNWLSTVLLLCGDIHPCPGPDCSTSIDPHNKFNVIKKRGLHFIHINVRSLFPKLDELRLIARETNAACIAISETWLDDSVFDSELSILNYNIYRRDRNRHGGGVCLYIRSDIAFNTREDLQHQDLESLWIELLLPKTNPFFSCYL